MCKKSHAHLKNACNTCATVCVVLGGKTVVEVIYICKSYLSYFCAFSEDLCYINFSLLNSPVIPVFIIADVPDWRCAKFQIDCLKILRGVDYTILLPLTET